MTESRITNRLPTFTDTQPEDDGDRPPAHGCAGPYIQGRPGLSARRVASRGCLCWLSPAPFRQGNARVADGRIQPAHACISCENFVKFGPVTSELTVLICERQVRHGQKTGLFRWISPDILDRFSQSYHCMKALNVQMMDLYHIFQFVKGCCHGNQIILP